jgi:hypothetical protein
MRNQERLESEATSEHLLPMLGNRMNLNFPNLDNDGTDPSGATAFGAMH